MQTEPNYVPLLAALITGVFSFAGAWLATKVSKDGERKHEARQLAKTFKGELSGIIHILELRDYQTLIKATAAACRTRNEVLIFSVVARQEYFAIYKANAGSIGKLQEPLPEQVAIFYTQAASLLEDFTALAEMRAGTKSRDILGSPMDAAARYEELADGIDALISRGKAAIVMIDGAYPG
jgi:hypothetical protein